MQIIIPLILSAIFGYWLISTKVENIEAIKEEAVAQKEQCIVLKHQKEAQKFLEQDCGRYVDYNK